MVPDLPVRLPGTSVPGAVRGAAAKVGRGRRPVDPLMLKRLRDALARLPDSATGPHYVQFPGDCLACLRGQEA
jgi:hypothetical protein